MKKEHEATKLASNVIKRLGNVIRSLDNLSYAFAITGNDQLCLKLNEMRSEVESCCKEVATLDTIYVSEAIKTASIHSKTLLETSLAGAYLEKRKS
jgi:hypothetical protein